MGTVDGIRVLNLRIKGDKPHEIALHPVAIKAIENHVEKLTELGFATDDPEHILFPGMKEKLNKPLTPEGLNYIFQSSLKRAGIQKSDFRRYCPHSMRVTLASHLLNTLDTPLEEVQKVLGHSSPTTTQRYNKREKGHDQSPVFRVSY